MKIIKHLLILLLQTVAFCVRTTLKLRYKVSLKGTDILKKEHSLLLLPNHQALVDPIILIANIYPYVMVSPAVTSGFYDFFLFKPFLKYLGAIRVSDLQNGSRNVNVLKDISRAIIKGLRREKSVVLYPSGQISNGGQERIANKKSAQKVVSKLPGNAKVIGVRINGLWGSMWSKAKTGKSPDFFLQLLKGVFYVLINFLFFLPKREVSIEFVDLTSEALVHSREDRKHFNSFIEQFYNQQLSEEPLWVSYTFLRNAK